MALSNWATLAFGEDGKSSDGHFTGSCGISVDIYKNWAYLRCSAIKLEAGWEHPTFAKIDQGELSIGSLEIWAKRTDPLRCRQHGILLVAHSRDRWFAGIGVGGYSDTSFDLMDFLGIPPDQHQNWQVFESSSFNGEEPGTREFELLRGDAPEWDQITDQQRGELFVGAGGNVAVEKYEIDLDGIYAFNAVFEEGTALYERFDSKWIGVLPGTVEQLMAWIEQIDHYGDAFKTWKAAVVAAQPAHFNQGDAFFAKVGIGELVPTPVGQEPPTPIIEQMLK